MRKSEQESEAAEQYEVRWRLDKDADKEEGRGNVDSGVRNGDGDGTVGLLSTGDLAQKFPGQKFLPAQGVQKSMTRHAVAM